MAVKIRLQRRGKKKQPVYRFVIQDSRVARDGKVIDIIGQYNPVVKPAAVTINSDDAKNWLSKGALPTKTVERLFIQVGILPKKEEKKNTKKIVEPTEEDKSAKIKKAEKKTTKEEVQEENK